MTVVYLGIGSNIGAPAENVKTAMFNIMAEEGILALGIGSVYETEPQGVKDQPWFVNTAIAVETELAPEELLLRLKKVEENMGRQPGEKDGPRLIDIDIVFYGDIIMETPELAIPHPLAGTRRFVLAPIVDISPDLPHPTLGKTVSQLLAELPEEGQVIRKTDI